MIERIVGWCLLLTLVSACKDDQAPDPVVLDIPIVYVKRALPRDEQEALVQADIRDPLAFNPGAQLILRDRASPEAAETIISLRAFPDPQAEADGATPEHPLIDIKDLEVSYDGTKIVFAMRAPEIENADEDEQPTWNIWEYDRETEVLRRVILSDKFAEAGQDTAPHYLPDGRIVFSSTRQKQSRANLLDESKPQFSTLDEDGDTEASVLHVMDADGENIRQISFNQSHDLDPAILDDGTIVYTRWDNAGSNDGMHLYTIKPDGTNLSLLYGRNSHDTGTDSARIQFVQARSMPNGQVLVLQKPYQSTYDGADLLLVDATLFSDYDRPLTNSQSADSTGQQSISVGEVRTDNTLSRAGRFKSAYPLFDGTNRLLVSWSQCRLLIEEVITENNESRERILPCTDENIAIEGGVEADPLYGLFVYDLDLQVQLPILRPVEGISYPEVVAMEPRPLPNVILDNTALSFDNDLANQNLGALHIRSVYDLDGVDSSPSGIAALIDPAQTLAVQRPARYVRIVKAASIPDDDLVDLPGTAFGASRAEGMREIIGYAPVAPDGSVKMALPADIPFMISVLDRFGRRTSSRHQAWLQLKPGEVLECHGCHEPTSNQVHGRLDALPASINPGAPSTNMAFTGSSPTLLPLQGETMAEVDARLNSIASPNLNLVFRDLWTDPSVRAPDPDENRLYANLTTPAPATTACLSAWNTSCRTIINYETHIHPLFAKDRRVLDVDGITVLADNTCIACHAPVDSMAQAKVPDAQLDLTDGPSSDEPDHFNAYRELLFNDNEQELVNGVLVDRLVPRLDANGNPLFQTDGNGNPILDGDGNPVPLTDPVVVRPSMSTAGSVASSRFSTRFLPGGNHAGRMTDDELKLLFEWLDIGAQYYNNPFDVPQ